jgi:hypothetical protein
MFEENDLLDPHLTEKLMIAAMRAFKKPILNLGERQFLNDHRVLDKSHDFLTHSEINAVPTVEVDGLLFPKEIPDYQFIKSFIKD